MARRLDKITGRHEYTAALGDPPHEPRAGADVVVGDANVSSTQFRTVVQASKWSEAWMEFSFAGVVPVTNEQEVYSDVEGRVEVTASGFTWRAYVHPETTTRQNDSILEVEIITPVRIRRDIEIQLDYPEGFDFFFQRPLTQQEIDDDCFRPPNVVGSYAVFWKDTWGKNSQYMTGKFGHIYRWEFKDSIGQTWSGDLSFDPVTKILTIPVPPANWWNQATYPVTCMGMGDTLGWGSAGASNEFLKNGRIDFYELNGTAGSSGTLDDIYVHNAEATVSTNIHFGCWDDSGTSPNNLINDTTGSYTGDAGWMSATGIGSGSITSGGVYWVCAFCEQNNDAKATYDGTQTDNKNYLVQAYGALPDTPADTESNTDRRYAAYINFSAAGGRTTKNTDAAPLGDRIGESFRHRYG
jgi:hypothetical protein